MRTVRSRSRRIIVSCAPAEKRFLRHTPNARILGGSLGKSDSMHEFVYSRISLYIILEGSVRHAWSKNPSPRLTEADSGSNNLAYFMLLCLLLMMWM